MDDSFKQAYRLFEDEPSVEVWEKINAWLDKEEDKRRFVAWKWGSLLVALLLSGFIVFDVMTIKPGQVKSNTGTPFDDKNKHQNNITGTSKVNWSDNPNRTPLQNPVAANSRLPGTNFINKSGNIFFVTWPGAVSKKQGATELPFAGADTNPLLISEFPNERLSMFFLNDVNSSRFSVPAATLALPLANQNPDLLTGTRPGNKLFAPFWQLSVYASYDQAGYRLDSDDRGTVSAIKHSEVPEPSYAVGAMVIGQFSKKWAIQSGLLYSFTNIGIGRQHIVAVQDQAGGIAIKYITSSGYAFIKPGFGMPPTFGDSLVSTEGKHTIRTISIPAIIKYTVGKNKITVSPAAGIEANFITGTRVETEIESASDKETVFVNKLEGARSFYWSAAAEVEINYQINDKICLTARPRFRQAFSPITKNNPVETFPRSTGIGLGLKIKL